MMYPYDSSSCYPQYICVCHPRYIYECHPQYMRMLPTVYNNVTHSICACHPRYMCMSPTVYAHVTHGIYECYPRYMLMFPTVYILVPHSICPHSISTVYTVGDIPWGTIIYTVGNIECSPRYIHWHVTHGIYSNVPHGIYEPQIDMLPTVYIHIPHGIYHVPHGIYTLAVLVINGKIGVYTVGNMGVPWGTLDILWGCTVGNIYCGEHWIYCGCIYCG